MPRKTYNSPKPETLSTHEELRNLRLAVQLRTDQVKLRRLEWDTQTIALPHITPMPGDGALQIRKAMTKGDLPVPRAPKPPPPYETYMDSEVYGTLVDLYLANVQDEWDRNPYHWLASVSAQDKRNAKR